MRQASGSLKEVLEGVRQLLFAGVMDELTLITHPVVAGSGRKLFGPEDATTRLELRDSQRTSKGNVVSVYALKR